ncbi:thermonuclease family protein [Candidatus Gottesmanbacteria bacterium]|nr:thermonuclease family protein [Candidatus Gottesmanbacteria bacterium]
MSKSNPFLIFLSLLTALSLLLNIKLLSDRRVLQPTYKVLEVIDGDTFKINNNRRVRLMGVNTPETGKCLASQAKEKLAGLVLGKDVTLSDQFSDPYGRIIANVFNDGKYINYEMLTSGLARMDYYENPHRDELKKAYEQAREKKLGIFGNLCISAIPPDSCGIKGNIDDNTQKKFYYLPNCNNYSQVIIDLSTEDQWYCSEAEAIKAGFTKSKTCN